MLSDPGPQLSIAGLAPVVPAKVPVRRRAAPKRAEAGAVATASVSRARNRAQAKTVKATHLPPLPRPAKAKKAATSRKAAGVKATELPKVCSATKATKALKPAVDRTLYEWTEREDDRLMEVCLGGDEALTLQDLSLSLSREPMTVLARIRDSEIPDMIGLDCAAGSEEECELFGLLLAGVPISMALRWCVALDEADERPTSIALEAAMTLPDLRMALGMARDAGIWFNRVNQTKSLLFLVGQPLDQVILAVAEVAERADAPTPEVISMQMFGVFKDEAPCDWTAIDARSRSSSASFAGSAYYGERAASRAVRRASKRSAAGISTKATTKKATSRRSWGLRSWYAKKKAAWSF